MNPLVLTSMAAASTSVGGCCAVLLQRRINLLIAFGSGVLGGAASFDLLPASASAAARSGHPVLLIFPIAEHHRHKSQSGAVELFRKL